MLYVAIPPVVHRRHLSPDEPVAIAHTVSFPPAAPPSRSPIRGASTVRRRRTARLCILVGLGWLAAVGPAQCRAHAGTAGAPTGSLTVALPGGPMQAAMQAAFFAPFTARTGIPVRITTWDGRLATLQNRARMGIAPDAGLMLMDGASARSACAEGLLRPIDPAAVPGLVQGGRTRLAVDAIGPCGLGAFATAQVLAWDRSRADSAPSWSDFWDVARRPGKRGLRRDPRGTLEIALLADGVPPADIYRTLSTNAGAERAFHKLDQLKPYLVWWETPAQAAGIIEAGAVLMTSAPNEAVAEADHDGHHAFAIQWHDALGTMPSWVMPGRASPLAASPAPNRAAPDPAAGRTLPGQIADAGGGDWQARQLLGFMLNPSRQADFLQRFPARSVLATPPASAEPVPVDSAATDQQDVLQTDEAFWATHLDRLQARFDAWIGE